MVEREPAALEREEGNLGKRFPLLERERPPLEEKGGPLMRAETYHYKR